MLYVSVEKPYALLKNPRTFLFPDFLETPRSASKLGQKISYLYLRIIPQIPSYWDSQSQSNY